MRELRKSFYSVYSAGYAAGVGRTNERNPYRDIRSHNGRITGARAYMKFWAEGYQDGESGLQKRYKLQ